MILELIGMFMAASGPAMGVSALAGSAVGAINKIDDYVAEQFPPEVFDETTYYIHHIVMRPEDARELGLTSSTFSLALSNEELGSYINHENWILSGSNNTPMVRAELRRLVYVGTDRFRRMTQAF